MHVRSLRNGVMVAVAVWLAIGLLILPGTAAAAVATDFEDVPLGTDASAIAIPGVEFVSSSGFTVQDSGASYSTLSGHILSEVGTSCALSISLRFDELQAGIGFLFASDRSWNSTTPDLVMYLYTGGNPTPGIGTRVYTGDFYGTGLVTGQWEGSVSVMTTFDYVVMFAPSGCLAIDNLNTIGLPRGSIGPDMIPLPLNAAVGTIIEPTEAMWAPMEDAYTDVILYPGMKLWVLGQDESGQYYKVALSGVILWVKVEAMGPNYDDTWQGHPLPTDVN